MKKTMILMVAIILLLFVDNSNYCFAQSPPWIYGMSGGASGADAGNSIVTDTNGNSYIAGYFRSPQFFLGSEGLTNSNTSDHTQDAFVMKLDDMGNVLWAMSAGGQADDAAQSLCLDAAGNCLISGYFKSSVMLVGNYSLTNTGPAGQSSDLFIIKLDPSGNVLWAFAAGGTGSEIATHVDADADGNAYVCGNFSSSSLSFDGQNCINSDPAGQSSDIFLAKFSASGNVVWVTTAGGDKDDLCTAVNVTPTGKSVICGTFESKVLLIGSDTLYRNDSTESNRDMLVAQYNSDGVDQWAVCFGAEGDEAATDIATDTSGNCYVTGYFDSPHLTMDNTTFSNKGSYDLFVAKLSSAGSVLWAKSAAGFQTDISTGIAVGSNGFVYFTGYFSSDKITFATKQLLNTSANPDIFVVKYRCDDGKPEWIKGLGGFDDDKSFAISINQNGNTIITGGFNSSNINCGPNVISSNGQSDIFVAKTDNVVSVDSSLQALPACNMFLNQSTGDVTVEVSTSEKYQIEIINILGQCVHAANVIGNTTVNISAQPAGIYFLKASMGDKAFIRKIIKQ